MTTRAGLTTSVAVERSEAGAGSPLADRHTSGGEDRTPEVPTTADDWLPRAATVRESMGAVILAAFLALMFLIPTRLVFPPLGSAGRPVVIAGVALLGIWVFTSVVRHGLPSGSQPIRWIVLAYLATQIVGYAAGYNRGLPEMEANSSDRWMIATFAFVGVAFCFADAPRHRHQIDILLRILLGFGAFAAIVGAAQFFAGFDLQLHITIPGLQPNSNLLQTSSRGTGGVARVPGLAEHYIEFGVVLAVLTPIAVHFALYERDPVKRVLRWGVVAAIAGAVPLSVSRAGIVALGIGMLTLATVWSWRLRYNAFVISIVALVLFRAVSPGVLGTLQALFFNADQDPSVQGRTDDYAVVFPLILDDLWVGRGAGTFMPERYILLDNQILYTLVSTGIAGLVGFLALFVGGIGLARSIRRRAAHDEDRHLAQALCASLVSCLLASLTFDSLSFVQFTALLSVLLGMVGALWRLSGTSVWSPAVTDEGAGVVEPPLWPDVKRMRA